MLDMMRRYIDRFGDRFERILGFVAKGGGAFKTHQREYRHHHAQADGWTRQLADIELREFIAR